MSPLQQAFVLRTIAEAYRQDSERLSSNPKMGNEDAQYVIADADIAAALDAIATKIVNFGASIH